MMYYFSLSDISSLFSGLGVNAVAFLSQLVSFGIVFFLLSKFAFPVITNVLEKRKALIQAGVENAARAREDLATATARAEQLLLDARKEGQQLIAQAQHVAEQQSARIQAQAAERAKQIEQQQVEHIRQEAERAKADIHRLVVNLSVATASKILERSITDADDARFVEQFVQTSAGV